MPTGPWTSYPNWLPRNRALRPAFDAVDPVRLAGASKSGRQDISPQIADRGTRHGTPRGVRGDCYKPSARSATRAQRWPSTWPGPGGVKSWYAASASRRMGRVYAARGGQSPVGVSRFGQPDHMHGAIVGRPGSVLLRARFQVTLPGLSSRSLWTRFERRSRGCPTLAPTVRSRREVSVRRYDRGSSGAATSDTTTQTPVTGRVVRVWAVTSGRCGWFSGWRRADSRRLCRVPGLTGLACVARRRPRTSGVT